LVFCGSEGNLAINKMNNKFIIFWALLDEFYSSTNDNQIIQQLDGKFVNLRYENKISELISINILKPKGKISI